jgi:hypothetical protein
MTLKGSRTVATGGVEKRAIRHRALHRPTLLVSWMAQDLIATLPPPSNGILHLIGDGSQADKRGAKNPVAQKGRKSKHHPWFFGIRFVLLIAAWDGYRIPVGFRLILPKRHPGYQNENRPVAGHEGQSNPRHALYISHEA